MCNLKSTKNLAEILEYKKVLKNINLNNKELVLFPTSIYLPFFYDVNYSLGSQNISIYNEGSHTGEILGSQLASLKVKYVLINHCEMAECLENINKKIKNAFKNNMKAVLCLGDKISKNKDVAIEELKVEINSIFKNLENYEIADIIIAFEPSWAINSSDIMNIDDLSNIAQVIKEYIYNEYNYHLPFIYGGGINEYNVSNLLKLDIIDGILLGNMANNPRNIVKLIENV
jgi:triosephosphate isomerase